MHVCMETSMRVWVFVLVCRVAAFPGRHAGLIHIVKSRMIYSTNWQHWEAACVCVRAWCGAVTIWPDVAAGLLQPAQLVADCTCIIQVLQGT